MFNDTRKNSVNLFIGKVIRCVFGVVVFCSVQWVASKSATAFLLYQTAACYSKIETKALLVPACARSRISNKKSSEI